MVFGDRMFYHVAIMTHSHSTKLEKECNLTKEEVAFDLESHMKMTQISL